jgi:prepilin-type N-terminal cleavage/methylation domain-containing protein
MKKQCRQAFTLIEVVIACAIFSLILEAVYTTLRVGQNSWNNYSTNILSRQEVRRALIAMSSELREAKNIFIIKDTESLSLNFETSSHGTISYVWNKVGEDAFKIIRKNYTNRKILANNISSLSFDFPVDNEIIIDVAGGKEKSFILKEKIALRLKTNLFTHTT